MMREFKNGEEVKAICFTEGQVIRAGEHCDKITVSMEYGQMAGVPWFEVWKDEKIISKWNAALCEGVLYE